MNHEDQGAAKVTCDMWKRLDIVFRVREYHHRAIWAVEQHFTWLLSTVSGAIGLVIFSTAIGTGMKIGLLTVLCIVGYLLSCIGLSALGSESRHFNRALQGYNLAYRTLDLPKAIDSLNSEDAEKVYPTKIAIDDVPRRLDELAYAFVRWLFKCKDALPLKGKEHFHLIFKSFRAGFILLIGVVILCAWMGYTPIRSEKVVTRIIATTSIEQETSLESSIKSAGDGVKDALSTISTELTQNLSIINEKLSKISIILSKPGKSSRSHSSTK